MCSDFFFSRIRIVHTVTYIQKCTDTCGRGLSKFDIHGKIDYCLLHNAVLLFSLFSKYFRSRNLFLFSRFLHAYLDEFLCARACVCVRGRERNRDCRPFACNAECSPFRFIAVQFKFKNVCKLIIIDGRENAMMKPVRCSVEQCTKWSAAVRGWTGQSKCSMVISYALDETSESDKKIAMESSFGARAFSLKWFGCCGLSRTTCNIIYVCDAINSSLLAK